MWYYFIRSVYFMRQLLSSLSYFSIFFAPFLLPLIVWIVAKDAMLQGMRKKRCFLISFLFLRSSRCLSLCLTLTILLPLSDMSFCLPLFILVLLSITFIKGLKCSVTMHKWCGMFPSKTWVFFDKDSGLFFIHENFLEIISFHQTIICDSIQKWKWALSKYEC